MFFVMRPNILLLYDYYIYLSFFEILPLSQFGRLVGALENAIEHSNTTLLTCDFFLKCKYYHFGCLQFSLQITKCLKNEFMFLKCQNKKSAPFITEIILRRIRATAIDAS